MVDLYSRLLEKDKNILLVYFEKDVILLSSVRLCRTTTLFTFFEKKTTKNFIIILWGIVFLTTIQNFCEIAILGWEFLPDLSMYEEIIINTYWDLA